LELFFYHSKFRITLFLSLDALLLVLVGTIGYALANTHNKSVFISVGDGAVYIGWLGVLIVGIIIASEGSMAGQIEDLGPAVAMLLHPLLYGYFVRLITKVLLRPPQYRPCNTPYEANPSYCLPPVGSKA